MMKHKHSANGGASAPDSAPAPEGPAIVVERRDAHQRCDFVSVECSEFGQLSDKSTANDRADTGDALEQVFVLTPDRAFTDGLVEIFIGSVQLGFQPTQVSLDAFSDRAGSCAQTVFLRHHHLDELSSTGDQRSQFQAHLIGQGTQRWTYDFGEAHARPLPIKA